MKYSAILLLTTVAFVAFAVAEAKLKRKYNDFNFVDEENRDITKATPAKKRWIHDPDSDLCVPLKCKKKELCLLENLYTAVCVSKKELHRHGDIIMSKSRYLAEEAKKKASMTELSMDADDDDDDDDDDEDDEDDDDDDDDMGEDEGDDIFYDNTGSFSLHKDNNVDDGSPKKCNSCPIVKPTFLCGSDNRTYSSLCRLDYHNCIQRESIKVSCKGFCPCKDVTKEESIPLYNKNKYLSDKPKKKIENKQQAVDKYSLIPEDFKYENKHYKYIKYTKNDVKSYKDGYYTTKTPRYYEKDRLRGDNEVNDEKITPMKSWIRKKECSDVALQNMGNRLLDWFSVIMADNKRRRADYKGKGLVFPKGCKMEVGWMFKHLDLDGDGHLTLQELYDLEHDQNEHCIKPFLDMCDTDRDIFVSPFEWCHCFMKSERPCYAVKKRIPSHVMGTYIPMCDQDGYYQPMQCHGATGMCWCVNKHGVEFASSRTHGKVDCDLYFLTSGMTENSTNTESTKNMKNKPMNNDVESKNKLDNDTDDNDDDESDDDDDFNGSGDQPLEF